MPEFIECSDGYGEYKFYQKGMGNVKYSFLVSAYNSESTIVTSLESILAQSVDDYEIVIIDDGSIDKTNSLIFDILEQFSNCIFIVQSNIGLTKSLNRGIKHVRGEYVLRHDADDISLSNRIGVLEENLSDDYDFYLAKALSRSGGVEKIIPRAVYVNKGVSYKALEFGNPFIHGTFAFRKKLFEKAEYNTLFKYSQDYEFILKCMELGVGFKFIDDVVYVFNQSNESISRKMPKSQAENARLAMSNYGLNPNWHIASRDGSVMRILLIIFREIRLRF